MKILVTQRIVCGISIPDGKSLTISSFTFLPDFEGEQQARHIKTIVEANTKEEAIVKANKLFSDFFAKLTLIDNSKYILNDDVSVGEVGGTGMTTTRTISGSAFIVKDGTTIKNAYESSIKNKHLRIRPIRLYRDAVNTNNLFERYRNFYRVLECYGTTKPITDWIKIQESKVLMKKNNHGDDITIYTWIRIKLSHSKNSKKDLVPFSISSSEDIVIVNKYLPKIQELVRKKIKEEEI
ncbi:hypothetical protein KJ980_00180 [Patescibacteria group bacterium]|nr:hypothetical protein [Patescibacteria group bacterium]MBU4016536.1 hypothetical protein [Patescibacteria group bacterium]MBU4098045.1 hypothetical protein [Patescibacteria group bacterium]